MGLGTDDQLSDRPRDRDGKLVKKLAQTEASTGFDWLSGLLWIFVLLTIIGGAMLVSALAQ